MLTDSFNEISDEVRIERGFKEDEDKDKLTKNMKSFNTYVLGGIEWFYEQFTDNCIIKEDYLGKIDEIVENYKLDFS